MDVDLHPGILNDGWSEDIEEALIVKVVSNNLNELKKVATTHGFSPDKTNRSKRAYPR